MANRETEIWVRNLIATEQLHRFYTSPEWVRLRNEVMAERRGECQWCKAKGLYVPAVVVHHIRFVRQFPALALSKVYTVAGKEFNNLVPLCKRCHELAHGDRLRGVPTKPLTEERW